MRKWNAWEQRSWLELCVKLNRTIRKRLDGILAIFENPGLTNEPIEGIAR